MGIDEVIEVLNANGISKVALFPGYVTLPKDHIIVTYGMLKKTAQGADGYALYWDITYRICLFYREQKTADDWAMEKLIENGLRACNNLTVEYDYNDTDKLDVTYIEFTTTEEF